MAAQICENCMHKHERCYCSPNSTCDKYESIKMVNKKSWDEFRNNGLLWWINMILHTFGWAIVTEIDKNKILKHMQSIPEEYVAQVIEQITGEAVDDNMNSFDLAKKIGNLSPLEYQDALKAFQPTQKQQLVLSLGKEHNEWFQLFDAHAYTNIINREKQQPEVVKAMSVIEPEHIQEMLKELPDDLLSIVITQMDTDKFAEILMDKFPEVIASAILK